MAAPVGVVKGDRVIVEDEREASTLQNKGYFGIPQRGGALELDFAEALFLVEAGRLAVEADGAKLDEGELMTRASAAEPGFDVRFVVYRDLRQRALVVRASNVSDFNVYPRGALPGKVPSTMLVRAASERTLFRAADVAREASRAAELGKRFLLAVVDEEGDLTHYDVALAPPAGETPPGKRALAARPPATLTGDRVVASDEATVRALREREHFGQPLGPLLQLSLAEAVYLAEAAGLRVMDAATRALVDSATLRARATALQPDFALREAVYRDLKARGLVVKTGFKFGTHLRAYEGAPDEAHAPFLVHALAHGAGIPWPEVAGFVRLAHGVRKDVLFAVPVEGDAFAYVRLRRTKP